MARCRKITAVVIVMRHPDRTERTTPTSWFDALTRMAAHFGDCKAVDQAGRVFARATSDGSGAVVVRMERGDGELVGRGAGMLDPGAAITLATRYSWRAPLTPDYYRDAALAGL